MYKFRIFLFSDSMLFTLNECNLITMLGCEFILELMRLKNSVYETFTDLPKEYKVFTIYAGKATIRC